MSIKILATIGPSSLNKDTIEELSSNGVNLFRINLSHTKLDDVANIIDDIHSWTDVPICLDSEGAQIRNHDMVSESVQFQEGSHIKIHNEDIIGDNENICFTTFCMFSVVCFRTLSVPNAMLDPHCKSISPQQGTHDFPLIFQ